MSRKHTRTHHPRLLPSHGFKPGEQIPRRMIFPLESGHHVAARSSDAVLALLRTHWQTRGVPIDDARLAGRADLRVIDDLANDLTAELQALYEETHGVTLAPDAGQVFRAFVNNFLSNPKSLMEQLSA